MLDVVSAGIRSIMPVLTSDRGYWTVRVRFLDGSESYLPTAYAYTMHQAQVAAESIGRDGADAYRAALGDLPPGVRVVKT